MVGSRHRNPLVSSCGASGITPVRATRPCDGRLPNRPCTCDGPRMEPPVSEPMVRSSQGYDPIPAPGPEDDDEGSW